ncbi:RE1, partial [Symbiodinium sp. KB8]
FQGEVDEAALGDSWTGGVGSKPGMMSELGMGLREERTGGDTDSPLAAGESEAGRVDVLEENQVLRRQIQAESHSSYHSNANILLWCTVGEQHSFARARPPQEYPEGEAVEESFPEGIEVIEEEPKDIEDLVLFGDLEVRNQNLRPLKSNCLKKRSKKGREVMLQVQGDAPAGNRAELAVQNLKGGVRKLLNDLYNTSIPFETAGDVARELHRAEAMNDWLEGVTIDVKSAFLYDDRWWIRKALYGLPTSPRDWGRYRDAEFRAFRMTWRGKEYQLLQTKTDDALWLARAVQEGNVGPIEGVLVVYVDDLAFFAPEGLAKAFISAVQSRWKTSEPAWLGEEPVTFCGIELSLQRTGYRMSQGAYIRELLHRYDVKDQSAVPMTKRVEPERAEALTVEEVREAQALTGALLWVSTRTRPDLSYVVSRWAALSRNMDSYPFLVPKDTLSVSSGSQGVDPSHEILEGPAEEEDDDEFTEEVGGSSGSGEKPVPKELTYEDFFEEGE